MREFDNFDRHVSDYRNVHNKNIQITGQTSEYFAEFKILELKSKYNLNSKKILDFGCGDGISYKFFKKHFPNCEYYGIDISILSVNKSREMYPEANFQVFDGFNIPFEDDYFDFVFSSCVFHHIEHKHHSFLFDAIYSKLKSTGLFIIFEHNTWNPLTLYAVNHCEFDEDAVLLPFYYTTKLFENSKFKTKILSFVLFFPRLNVLSLLLKLEKYFSWCPFGAQYYLILSK